MPRLQSILKAVTGKERKELQATSRDPDVSKAIVLLSKDSLRLTQMAASNATKVKMLPYDNFNWTARTWESTALHASVTHDEVSASFYTFWILSGRELISP
ncbi:hypothetical protein DXG03_000752 [Asterophora parasitica]|uniref:Uncharacterized protein n=1 Tax=Asterophora parasitica TaxID=117018 RepID=A0A9P7K9T0_9AGAR|nr:hypothetical protein DXG03_000752 [Asterophora parasitica]